MDDCLSFFALTGGSDNHRLAAALNKDYTPFPLLLIGTLTLAEGFMSNSKVAASLFQWVAMSEFEEARKRNAAHNGVKAISWLGWLIRIPRRKNKQTIKTILAKLGLEILARALWQLIIIWGKQNQLITLFSFIDLRLVIFAIATAW